jgi:putative transposase
MRASEDYLRGMPRTARSIRAGICYHVINRGNARATVFHDDLDYEVFEALAFASARRAGAEVLAYCLMPNHFHFVLRPVADDGLSKWAHWLLTSHVHRHRMRHASVGRIWQGRYKAFPVQSDPHLFAVLRYVERNALRAGLVSRAEAWPWGSLARRSRPPADEVPALHAADLPPNWHARVNEAESAAELRDLRISVNRGTPYGEPAWQRECAEVLGLQHTLRGRGRPSGGGGLAGRGV